MKTISINNQKGGVGKTTTTIAMAKILRQKGHKVLIVDCDGSSLTLTKLITNKLNLNHNELNKTLTNLILTQTLGKVTKEEVMNTLLDDEGIKVIPACNKLTIATTMLGQQNDLSVRFLTIKKILDTVKEEFDYCLLDAAPVLDLLSHNELIASDELIIVSQCQKASIEAIRELDKSVRDFVKPTNPKLEVKGILLTMLDKRSKNGINQIVELKEKTNIPVFETVIPRAVVGERYLSQGADTLVDVKNKVGNAYSLFVDEYLGGGNYA